jgi:hypothetical protein
MMKLLLLLIALAVGAIVYPRYAEHSNDVCGALGKRLGVLMQAARPQSPQATDPRTAAAVSGLARAATNQNLANAYMQARYPQVPETVRCAIAYWTTVMDPDVAAIGKRLLPFVRPPK